MDIEFYVVVCNLLLVGCRKLIIRKAVLSSVVLYINEAQKH